MSDDDQILDTWHDEHFGEVRLVRRDGEVISEARCRYGTVDGVSGMIRDPEGDHWLPLWDLDDCYATGALEDRLAYLIELADLCFGRPT